MTFNRPLLKVTLSTLSVCASSLFLLHLLSSSCLYGSPFCDPVYMPYYGFKPTILTGVSLEDHVSAQQQSEVLANIYHNLISLLCDIRRAT